MTIYNILNIITMLLFFISIVLFLVNFKSQKSHDLGVCIILMIIFCFFKFLKIDDGFLRAGKLISYVLFFLFFYAFLDILKKK